MEGLAKYGSHTVYVPGGKDLVAAGAEVGLGQTCRTPAPGKCQVDYSGLRLKNHTVPAISPSTGLDAMYVEYGDGGFSYYDCEVDPYQTKDLYAALPVAQRQALSAMLAKVVNCSGAACP